MREPIYNYELFKKIFGLYATELWAKPEKEFLEWLNAKAEKEVKTMQVELEADGYADGELVYDYGKCPECGWEFEEGDKDWEEPYCCHCGQKLKWFESEEEE